jgi:hypothetical protein
MGGLMKTLLLTLLLAACSHSEQDSTGDRLPELREKYELYQELQKDIGDPWILSHKCDSALEQAIRIIGGGANAETIYEGIDPTGRTWRRPTKDCLETGSSQSTTSPDMVLGYTNVALYSKDLQLISDLINYGEENDWTMGEHNGTVEGKSRVYFQPKLTLQSYMYQVRHHLGGAQHGKQTLPQDYTPFKKGFEKHLVALIIMGRGEMNGKINQIELNTIRDYAKDDPNNSLFQAIAAKYSDGNQNKAIATLLNERYFPKDRLPEATDRCAPYLWMHGEKHSTDPQNPDDWDQCKVSDLTHPGHDFLIAAKLILGAESE